MCYALLCYSLGTWLFFCLACSSSSDRIPHFYPKLAASRETIMLHPFCCEKAKCFGMTSSIGLRTGAFSPTVEPVLPHLVSLRVFHCNFYIARSWRTPPMSSMVNFLFPVNLLIVYHPPPFRTLRKGFVVDVPSSGFTRSHMYASHRKSGMVVCSRCIFVFCFLFFLT